MSQRIVKVTRDQIESAKALIRLRGGEDKVDPDIVLIANARRRPRPTNTEPLTP
ncbi:hypothetical protein JNB_19788 [Janibacter sp. HTCC2649]|uniref:hypothetical protein n=1 Tax=Janibacter sp. HTCC2649 TaxID=313589 RepID=UPI0000670FFC|nr:hypothetical protein [Janibacter sp. HTCC2649]EAP97746.1 hypothetical protein JNB_19788 [Janibacter sp. HTCC2649]